MRLTNSRTAPGEDDLKTPQQMKQNTMDPSTDPNSSKSTEIISKIWTRVPYASIIALWLPRKMFIFLERQTSIQRVKGCLDFLSIRGKGNKKQKR